MEIEKIQQTIRDVIASIADPRIDPRDIDIGEGGIGKLGLSSLELIRMLAEIQLKLEVEIDLDETGVEILTSVERLAACVFAQHALAGE
jgi:acyl carrier protein